MAEGARETVCRGSLSVPERAGGPSRALGPVAGAGALVPETLRARIFAVVRAVPWGGIVSYGDVARICGTIPVVVGKALAHCPDDVPWQRVIGRDGTLRTARRGAAFAARQRELLEAEGIVFADEDRVSADDEGWERGLEGIARSA